MNEIAERLERFADQTLFHDTKALMREAASALRGAVPLQVRSLTDNERAELQAVFEAQPPSALTMLYPAPAVTEGMKLRVIKMIREEMKINADDAETLAERVLEAALSVQPQPVAASPNSDAPYEAVTAAPQPVDAEVLAALEREWTDFLDANPDGLTSPEDLPDHALVTFEQMSGIVRAALSRVKAVPAQGPVAFLSRAIAGHYRGELEIVGPEGPANTNDWSPAFPVYTSPVASSGWMPMSEAPRDGTAVLLFTPSQGCWIGLFNKSKPTWELVEGGDHSLRMPSKPTYWQPLPTAPRSPEGTED